MTETVNRYEIGGLDLRSNDLTRTRPTAIDCRNIYLDSNRKLIKRFDTDQYVLDYGTSGEVGDFLNKIPFGFKVMDLMPFEDHIVIAVKKQQDIASLSKYYQLVKFYKWDKTTSTLEFIPFQSWVSPDAEIGDTRTPVDFNIEGKFSYLNINKCLYFSGQYNTTDLNNTESEISAGYRLDTNAKDNNLSFVMKYDGKVISNAGIYDVVSEDTNETVLGTNEEWIRTVPFTIDYKGNYIYGDYSTLKSSVISGASNLQEVIIPQFFPFSESRPFGDRSFFLSTGSVNINESDSAATRTIPIKYDVFDEYGFSIGKGQYLYSIKTYRILTPISAPHTKVNINQDIYRAEIADIDYTSEKLTLFNFYKFNKVTQVFDKVKNFRADSSTVLSNVMYAIYGSTSSKTEGFTYRGIFNVYNDSGTQKAFFTGSTGSVSDIVQPTPIGSMAVSFEDFYDESTVKLTPPKTKSITNYVGTIVLHDEKTVYTSDISLGGSIETFHPFDTFLVGSSDFGNISGIFANETFLAVFRERESYYITGNIFTKNYRVQSYKSTRVGCSDARSILSYKGSGIFAHEKGIYVCNQGGQMDEISDIIEPLFISDSLGLDLDMTNVKSHVDYDKELFYFDITNKSKNNTYIIVYSYYWKEWFIFDFLESLGGSLVLDNTFYGSDGQHIYIENKNSSISSTAYYTSMFEHLGFPQNDKKFLRSWVSTKEMGGGELLLSYYKDWNKNIPYSEVTKTILENELDLQDRPSPDRCRSMALRILSDSGQEMIIDGYSLEVDDLSSETVGNDRTK